MGDQRQIIPQFGQGFWGEKLSGRLDAEGRLNSLSLLENFFITPQGAAMVRPGFENVTSAFEASTSPSYALPFHAADADYVIVFGKGASAASGEIDIDIYNVSTGAKVADINRVFGDYALLDEYKYVQRDNLMILTHPKYYPIAIRRHSNTLWSASPNNIVTGANHKWRFKVGPQIPGILETGTDDLIVSYSGAKFITVTIAGVYLELPRYLGNLFVSGNANGIIRGYSYIAPNVVAGTVLILEIINEFPITASYETISAQQWYIAGSPLGKIAPDATGEETDVVTFTPQAAAAFQFNTIPLLYNDDVLTPIVASGAVSSAYYLKSTADIYTDMAAAGEPADVRENGVPLTKVANPAAIANPGEWAWGDADTLGYNTIYVRLFADANPNLAFIQANGDGYLTALYTTSNNFVFHDDSKNTSDADNILYFKEGVFKIIKVYKTGHANAGKALCQVLEPCYDISATFDWTYRSNLFDHSAIFGYPRAVAIYEDRLVFSGVDGIPQGTEYGFPDTIFMSRTGDFFDFTLGANDNDGIRFQINSTTPETIKWMMGKELLFVGTDKSEWAIGSRDSAITPTSILVQKHSPHGSNDSTPLEVNNIILFADRLGYNVREFIYQDTTSNFIARSISELADELFNDADDGNARHQIRQMAYILNPFPILFVLLDTDRLLYSTYIPERDMIAWGEIKTASLTEFRSVVSVRGAKGDELWIITFRDVAAGAGTVSVERMRNFYFGDNVRKAIMVDCAYLYDGAATDTFSVPFSLKNETVDVVADGVYAQYTTVDQTLTLDAEASVVQAGYFTSAKLRTQRLDMQTNKGTNTGYLGRITEVITRLYNTVGGKVGPDPDDSTTLEPIPNVAMSATYGDNNGDRTVPFADSHKVEKYVAVVQDQPFPMTLTALIIEGRPGNT